MTSTEVAIMQSGVTELEQWASDLITAYQMAEKLVTTSFVPSTYNGKPQEAAAAILTGQELGLSPLAALRSIDIIHGTPGMRAIALRALVQSAGHEIWTDESTQERCVVRGRRRGSDKVETSTWDMARAQRLQLTGKDNWRKQPIAMLLARATSECARLIAADVLLGIPYSIEELEDLGPEVATPAGEEATPKRRPSSSVKRAPLDPARGEAPEPDGSAEGAVGAAARGAAKQEARELEAAAERESPAEDPEEVAARLAEEERLADEARAEEQRVAAAAAFERPMLDEPSVDWDGPGVES